MLGRLGRRVHAAALDFAAWAPSASALLLIASQALPRESDLQPRLYLHVRKIIFPYGLSW